MACSRPTSSWREALRNWNNATGYEVETAEAFWEAMMAANRTETFADQRSIYGLAERGWVKALGCLTGLRGRQLQMLVDRIHSHGGFDRDTFEDDLEEFIAGA